jgi:hypothetical protein
LFQLQQVQKQARVPATPARTTPAKAMASTLLSVKDVKEPTVASAKADKSTSRTLDYGIVQSPSQPQQSPNLRPSTNFHRFVLVS